MIQNQKVLRSTLIPLCALLAVSVCVACSDKKTTTTTVPAPASTAPASSPANTSSSSSAPVIAPGTAEDVTKKGTSTGMVGGRGRHCCFERQTWHRH